MEDENFMIYLDNAATTSVSKEVFNAMAPYFCEDYGNPSSIYSIGQKAHTVLDNARAEVAKALNAEAKEVFFTGSGTESVNWAIKGVAACKQKKGRHIVTTNFEHHAGLHACQGLERQGFSVTYLEVDHDGMVDIERLKSAIREDTILISVMFANNEIGVIEPVAEIGAMAREADILFHTDAVQAAGAIPIDVKAQNIDLLSVSAHKFHGPKGVGALYVRKGVRLPALIDGGAQESNKRAGTENVAGIVGMAAALKIANNKLEENSARITKLRDKLIEGVLSTVPHVRLNGHRTKRLPGNCNFSFEFIEGESILLLLDMKGVCASSGSACASSSLDPSHVLLALGVPHELAHGSIRFTIGNENTEEEIDQVLDMLPGIVQNFGTYRRCNQGGTMAVEAYTIWEKHSPHTGRASGFPIRTSIFHDAGR
jgi:cysteine desulfurase